MVILGIGPSKCASTTLHEILCGFNGVVGCEIKEKNIFSRIDFNPSDHESIRELVDSKSACFIDVSPIYAEVLTFSHIIKNIQEFGVKPKIIMVGRPPIERLSSAYKQLLHTGHWYQDNYFKLIGIRGVAPMNLDINKSIYTHPALFRATCFADIYRMYEKAFGGDSILALTMTDFGKSDLLVEKLSQFLGLEFVGCSNVHLNKGESKTMLNPRMLLPACNGVSHRLVRKLKKVMLPERVTIDKRLLTLDPVVEKAVGEYLEQQWQEYKMVAI